MKKASTFAGLCAFVFMASAPLSRAAVTYTFTGVSLICPIGAYTSVCSGAVYRPAFFQLTLPDFLQLSPALIGPPTIGGTEAYFTCDQGVFGSPCGDYDSNIPPRDVIFTYQPETWAGAAGADVLAYSYINGNGDVFQFPTGAFQQPGTYNDDPFFPVGDSSGILTVSTTSTPEPASIPLAAVGVLILAIVIRRKAKVMPRISELG